MKDNKKLILLFLVLILILSCSQQTIPPPQPFHYQRVIVFGDSLTDIGNCINQNTLSLTAQTSFSSQGYRNTWVYYLLTKYNHTYTGPKVDYTQKNLYPYPIGPYKDTDSHSTISYLYAHPWAKNTLIPNLDFAYIGADSQNHYLITTDSSNKPICSAPGFVNGDQVFCIPGLAKQVNSIFPTVFQNYISNGVISNDSLKNSTLYILWSGSNDILNGLPELVKDVDNTNKLARDVLAIYPLSSILDSIKTLIHYGIPASHILVLGLPDISKTPVLATLPNALPADLSVAKKQQDVHLIKLSLATIVTTSNYYTKIACSSLGVRFFDVNSVFEKILSNPLVFTSLGLPGFKNVSDSCVANMMNPLCEGYFFYDIIHPTTDAHKILAYFISNFLG